jgi:hypothetical protein
VVPGRPRISLVNGLLHQGEPSLAGQTRFSSLVAATSHVGLVSNPGLSRCGTGVFPGRRGPDQPADRPGAVHHAQDRQPPRLTDPGQAGVAGRGEAAASPTGSASTNNDPLTCGLFPRPVQHIKSAEVMRSMTAVLPTADIPATQRVRANVLVRPPERVPQEDRARPSSLLTSDAVRAD